MHIEISHDNNTRITSDTSERLAAQLEASLDRFGDRLTRVEMHLQDTNAAKHGPNDKRCMIEARLAGLAPIAVTHEAESLELAIDTAMDKIERALEHAIERQKAS